MDNSNTIITITQASVHELTAHTCIGKQDIQSVLISDANNIISNTVTSGQELSAEKVTWKKETESVVMSGSDLIIPKTQTRVGGLEAQTFREAQATKTYIKDGCNTGISNTEAGLRELTEQTVRGKQDIMDGNNPVISNTEADLRELTAHTFEVKQDIMDVNNTDISNADSGLQKLTAHTIRGDQGIESVIMDTSNTMLPNTEAGVQELPTQEVRWKHEIQSVTIDTSNTMLSNTEVCVQEMTAQLIRGDLDIESAILDSSNTILSNPEAGVQELPTPAVRGKQDIQSVIKDGSNTFISNAKAGLQKLTAQAIKHKHVIQSAIKDGTNALRSTTMAGVRELKVKSDLVGSVIQSVVTEDILPKVDVAKREIIDFMTNDDEDNYSRRTGAVHVGVHSDVCYVKPKRGTRWKYDDCNNYDLCNSSYRNYGNVQDKTHSKFSKKPSPQIHSTKFAGVVHDGVCCNVCTLSPITGTRWKCSECPDYDMCHSCYKIYRHVHSKTHSFTKIGTPGSLSTKEQKKAHEVHETPSIMPSDLTKIKRDEHVKTVYLETSRKEFITVMGKFIQTLDKEIVSIRSVQNKYLWEFYFVKRGQMESINGKIGANEMNLYHGTKPDIIHTVCAQNLDMRLAGTNVGAILGNGTYFASAAHMSDSYATPDPNTGHKFMLQCRVLVGRWTKGQPGLQRPPEVAQTSDGQVRLYDSCVDRVRNPRVFCIFDHVQCYPEYIIEYK